MRFYVANYSERFRREVIEAFADAYLAGRTPIPCVTCNKSFKFDYLLERARVLRRGARGVGPLRARGRRSRRPGSGACAARPTPAKDQTYFLFQLDQAQLAALELPLGDLAQGRGARARARARPRHRREGREPGDLLRAGRRLRARGRGAAPGRAARSRRDRGRAGPRARPPRRHPPLHGRAAARARDLLRATPLRDAHRRRAQPRAWSATSTRSARAARAWSASRWVAGAPPPTGARARVRVRYRHAGADASLEPARGRRGARALRRAGARRWRPGQAAVFDAGDVVLGGGFLAEALA